MITSIGLKNFKSYSQAHLALADLTLFIGANASGKSNALEGIRLLSWLAKGQRLDDVERNIQGADKLVRGQATDLFLDNKSPLSIDCSFGAMKDDYTDLNIQLGLTDDHLGLVGETVKKGAMFEERIPLYTFEGATSPHTDSIQVTYDNFSKGRNKPKIPCSNRQAVFYQLETPSRFDSAHEQSQEIIPAVTGAIRTHLRNITFLDPRPSMMRDYSFEKDNKMKENGSNLSSVLFSICKTNKSKVLDCIRSLPEQDITDIRFIETERNDVMLKLVESFGGKEKEVPAPLLSDGTLRVLAIAATLLSAPIGALVIIEEIDNGVHPSRARKLIEHIQTFAKERQIRVLLTTHNPAMLDAVPDSALEDVLCCYRDSDDGTSKIERLGYLNRYPELVAQGSLGELATSRVLDRFLKDKTTPENRKQKASEWLKSLKSETAE